jgi:transcriptional regulator with XRE-family HTH domain
MSYEESPDPLSVAIGARIRKVRKSKDMSLQDVELLSKGEFTASSMGAYERAFRKPSVARLKAVADFYQVPVTVLLGSDEPAPAEDDALPSRLIFDLGALNRLTGEPAWRVRAFVRAIELRRGDYNGRVITCRGSDLMAVGVLMGADDAAAAVAQLRSWGVLIEHP